MTRWGWLNHWFIRVVIVCLGVWLPVHFLLQAVGVLPSGQITVSEGTPQWVGYLMLSLLFIFGITLFTFIGLRIGYIEMVDSGFRMTQCFHRRVTRWENVKAIYPWRFVTPFMYRISFKDGQQTILVAPLGITLCVGFWSWHFSDFRKEFLERWKAQPPTPLSGP